MLVDSDASNKSFRCFRFCNNVGEIYAVAKYCNFNDAWLEVGFAACSPVDRSLPRKMKLMRGYGKAKSRLVNPVLVPVTGSISSNLTPYEIIKISLYEYILDILARGNYAQAFGFRQYHDSTGGNFRNWFRDFVIELEKNVKRASV